MPLNNTDQCGEVKLRQNQDSERTWTNIVCVRGQGDTITPGTLWQEIFWHKIWTGFLSWLILNTRKTRCVYASVRCRQALRRQAKNVDSHFLIIPKPWTKPIPNNRTKQGHAKKQEDEGQSLQQLTMWIDYLHKSKSKANHRGLIDFFDKAQK